ncbi:hypothetical protein ACW9IB_03025 [Pseudomonas sp. SDO524_S393]
MTPQGKEKQSYGVDVAYKEKCLVSQPEIKLAYRQSIPERGGYSGKKWQAHED